MIVLGTILAAVILLIILIIAGFKSYVVVEPNKAHVVVSMGGGRKIYHPSLAGTSSAYVYIPMLMRRIIVSLENVKHEIPSIELRDKNLAPFMCDITCWFKIVNPELAAEKLSVAKDGDIMDSIRETLDAQIQGVARAAAMGQEIVELMRDRTTFGTSVFREVNGDLNEWGVQLVKLEIIEFSDTQATTVIQNYEARREAEIASLTRQTVAVQTQQAEVKEAEAQRIAQQARIDSEQAIKMRDIERSQTVGIREQQANLSVAQQMEKANLQQVSANKARVLGEATYTAEATVIKADGEARSQIKLADGKKQSDIIAATGNAQAVKLNADAQAEAINKTGTAEAEVVQKKAEAQKQFTDASKDIELAKIGADITKTKYQAMAEAIKSAEVKIISPDMSFFGFGAKEGAGLGTLIDSLEQTSGVSITDVIEAIKEKTVQKPVKTK